MNLTRAFLNLTAAALLLSPVAAFADNGHHRRERDRHHGQYERHVPPAPPARDRHGRYELRTTQRWVEGRWVDEWVEGRCYTKERRHHTVTKCTDGRYERRWIPGRYEPVQEWVWVSFGHGGWNVSMRW